ncbi:MAG: SAM-dependent methyltransferase [Bacteroidetes bacterium]|nr:SAM-dependent methyltransferase [Bacteroidota bacterium]
MNTPAPVLYLIPSTLGDVSPQDVIPQKTLQILKKLDHFIVEEERTARRFLIKAGINKPVDAITFFILNEHTGKENLSSFFENSGNTDMGLLSEAGVPAVADPGTDLIRVAHRMGFRVVPLVGPSSVLLAVMASGLNGQNFAFTGYLPVKTNERAARIRFLEKRSLMENQAQVFIEAPYRNNQLMKSILETCSPETWLCIASNITLEKEWISTRTIAEWKREIPDLNKQPSVFILQKI